MPTSLTPEARRTIELMQNISMAQIFLCVFLLYALYIPITRKFIYAAHHGSHNYPAMHPERPCENRLGGQWAHRGCFGGFFCICR